MMEKIPHHLGIILDGNRRWAEAKGLPPLEGHRQGLDKVKKIVGWCLDRGIRVLTLFLFSTENWSRSKREINYLMRLAKAAINDDLEELDKKGIKVKVIGQKERLPRSLWGVIDKAENLTKDNKEMILNFAMSYGGRAEIVEAFKNIVKKKVSPAEINEELIKENLWTSDVDLIIRTGKEQRMSNFLIWQGAYSELYFSPKYWPDFTEKDLDGALLDYNQRQRRFGK